MLPATTYGLISLVISIVSAILGALHSGGMVQGVFAATPADWTNNFFTYAISIGSGIASVFLLRFKAGVKNLDSTIGNVAVTGALDLLYQHFSNDPASQDLVRQLANANANRRYITSGIAPTGPRLAQV